MVYIVMYRTNGFMPIKLHGEEGLSSDRGRYTQAFTLSVLRYKEQHRLSANGLRCTLISPQDQRLHHGSVLTMNVALPFICDALEQSSPISKSIDIKKILKIPLTELSPQELLRRAQYLEAENAYLKKLEALTPQKNLVSKNKSK